MSIELEERCYSVMALQQPMASDLRRLTTALWMNAEIERNGGRDTLRVGGVTPRAS